MKTLLGELASVDAERSAASRINVVPRAEVFQSYHASPEHSRRDVIGNRISKLGVKALLFVTRRFVSKHVSMLGERDDAALSDEINDDDAEAHRRRNGDMRLGTTINHGIYASICCHMCTFPTFTSCFVSP